jgi:murein endopeptidase
VLLLAVAVAGIPVAAFGEGDMGGRAAAADPTARVVDDGPFTAELPMRVTVRVARSERSGPILTLDDASVAHGTPNGGSLSGAVRLPVRGEGYYTYDPATQRAPQSPDRRWGTAVLVDQVLELGRWWAARHPGRARLGVGDLSRPAGGPFTGPVVGHSSHQNGLDVDIRLPRRDGVEGPATPSDYDRALTQAVVDRLVSQGASLVLIGPNLDLRGPSGVVVRWPNHDDHLHVRFPDPDGAAN